MKKYVQNNKATNEPAASKLSANVRQLQDNRARSVLQQAGQDTVQQKANKTGMPDKLKSGIENLSGHSMDDVKVHYNSSQPAQLNARAYAQGNQIHIAPGQEKHLSHEAWHVVQQKQGRVKPTKQLKGKTNINDNASLEKEADVMGAKAMGSFSTMHSRDGIQLKALEGGDAVIQRVLLYRFMNPSEETAWTAKSQVIGKDISELAPTKQQLALMAEQHKENIDSPDSPFISMTIDPRMAAEAGSLKTIVSTAPHVIPFKIPSKYVVPLSNEVSLREGEMLVWLPKGISLKKFLIPEHPQFATRPNQPAIWDNRYKGLSLEQIEALHKNEKFHGARLEPKGGNVFVHRELGEQEGIQWRQARNKRDRDDEKKQDKTAHVVKSGSTQMNLHDIFEYVQSLHHSGKKKHEIIAALKVKLAHLPNMSDKKIESFYNIGMGGK